MLRTALSVLCLASAVCGAAAFGFNVSGEPSECDNLSISWSGGTAPFELLLIPVFGTPRNISIPSESFSNNGGSYEFQVPFNISQKFVMTMSDATGFNSGGTTDLFTTGSSQGGSCTPTEPGVAYNFQLNSALQQCRPYTINGYDGAVQPVSITGIIPGGEAIVINPPTGSTSYDWTANVYNGTSIIFMMYDSEGRTGGSSDVRSVSTSDDTSCINDSSPHTTAQPTSTGSAPASTSTASSGTPIGAIAGTVIGSLIFLAVVITLGLFFLKKRAERRNAWSGGGRTSMFGGKPQSRLPVDLTDGSSSLYPLPTTTATTPSTAGYPYSTHRSDVSDPFRDDDGPSSGSQLSALDQSASEVRPFTQRHSIHSSTSAAQRKAAMAGVGRYGPSRYVLHTDLEDAEPSMSEDGVVELPPQYSEKRGSQKQQAGSSTSSTQPPPPPAGAGYAYSQSSSQPYYDASTPAWRGPS